MKIANFISTFEMYDKEESGIKSNTLRISNQLTDKKLDGATHVRMFRGYTGKFFTRKITDKTKWNGMWIVSWEPLGKVLI